MCHHVGVAITVFVSARAADALDDRLPDGAIRPCTLFLGTAQHLTIVAIILLTVVIAVA